ncbi:dihydroorotate dehydrogenase electron transfer subunit [Dialister sp.]|uniref:dihydroorotate dehydrogenase electron transfer subunit n=1 Tax=Dialister sp. TaxID=1955814 RepID=UPI002E81D67A|nr:dihydroorotate dehydrogenase electron transfer subunit [Dialister sp.]MEE3452503.1 dihydroorotate dehydrogenase electron transfer subunit [Dialister sp.]
MSGYVEKGIIRIHKQVGPEIWLMQIELPRIAKEAKPGQFVHVKVNDPRYILRRPISIAGADAGRGMLEIIYRIVGTGTEAMSHMKVGDTIDCLGPLGTSFDMDKDHIVGVGGGVGIAPILFMSRRAKPGQMTVVIGGRNKEEVFWKDLFPDSLKNLIVTTDDGSYGIKGFSVSVLPELFKKEKVDEVCVCGPGIMMKITAQMAKDADVPCQVSMERRMGCGIGTCLGCVCDRKDGKGHYKVCEDGPVFNAEEVVL